MQELVDFMVQSVVKNTDAISLNVTEGDASVLFELEVDDADRARLVEGDPSLVGAMRQILAASSGERRGVLELVGEAETNEE